MTVYYGIKCISSKSTEPVATAGRGGWTLGVDGRLETWCRTFLFPFNDINEVYREFCAWSPNGSYTYRVEEIPPSLLDVLLDDSSHKTQYTFKLKNIEDQFLNYAVDDAKATIQAAEDEKVFNELNEAAYGETIPAPSSIKYDKASNLSLKDALRQLAKYAATLENKKVKSFNDGYANLELDKYSLGGEY